MYRRYEHMKKLFCGCNTWKRYLTSGIKEKRGPLDGIRVCDLTSMVAGPFCTMVLGDMGAEVIKVEDTEGGDDSRQWGPPFIGKESCYYLSINRNKKSICIDINKGEGKNIVYELVKKSDVFVENFITGKLSSMGLGYDKLAEINPLLVYCSISGFGSTGPESKKTGDNTVVSAMGGLMSITGPQDGHACIPGAPVTDVITALYANGAINAALYERIFSKQGKKIETSMLQSQISYLSHIVANYLNAGQIGKKYGTAHSSIVPYQAFKTADDMIIIAAGNDQQFNKTCKALGLCQLIGDERFNTNADRVINRNALLNIMEERLVTRASLHWLKALEEIGVPCGPVNSVGKVFEMAQVAALDLIQEISHPTAGSIKVAGPAFDYGGKSILAPPIHPPLLGQHTEEVLKGILHFSDDKLLSLIEKMVIKIGDG